MGKVRLDLGEESAEEDGFKINKGYADKYEQWRSKEVLQKLKDKYKNQSIEDEEDIEEDDSTSESEPEWTAEDEKSFLRTLGALKSKDAKIYDQNQKFFTAKDEAADSSKKPKKAKKPEKNGMTLRDYEVALVTEREGKFDDEDVEEEPQDEGYFKKNQRLKDEFKSIVADSSDDEEEGFMKKRVKTVEEKDKEEEDYAEWLKGEGKGLKLAPDDDMKSLKKAWNKPELDESEQFLRDYLLDKKYDVDADEDPEAPTYEDIVEDETEIEKADDFEHKYNFRFEEPDQDFIKQFPRTVKESIRKDNEKRKETRDQVKQRKKEELNQKKEEIKLLKSLKKKEIEERMKKLKATAGDDALPLSIEELADEKTFEKYFDDYYSLDYEDIIGDLRTKFKYRNVPANNFGLTTDEVLKADDKQLNQWVSVKKASQYRSEKDEEYDRKVYEQKAQTGKKEKIFIKKNVAEESSAGQSNEKRSATKMPKTKQQHQQEEAMEESKSKRKNRRKNKSSKKAAFQNGPVKKINGVEISRLKAYDVSNNSLKRKIYGNAANAAKKQKTS